VPRRKTLMTPPDVPIRKLAKAAFDADVLARESEQQRKREELIETMFNFAFDLLPGVEIIDATFDHSGSTLGFKVDGFVINISGELDTYNDSTQLTASLEGRWGNNYSFDSLAELHKAIVKRDQEPLVMYREPRAPFGGWR